MQNWIIEDAIEEWDMYHVYDWLVSIGLKKVATTFVSQHIDGEYLLGMREEDMLQLGVTVCNGCVVLHHSSFFHSAKSSRPSHVG